MVRLNTRVYWVPNSSEGFKSRNGSETQHLARVPNSTNGYEWFYVNSDARRNQKPEFPPNRSELLILFVALNRKGLAA